MVLVVLVGPWSKSGLKWSKRGQNVVSQKLSTYASPADLRKCLKIAAKIDGIRSVFCKPLKISKADSIRRVLYDVIGLCGCV